MAKQKQDQLAMLREKKSRIREIYAADIVKKQQEKAERRKLHGLPDPEECAGADQLEGMSYTVHIVGTSDHLPWYQPHTQAYHTLHEAKAAKLWTYPTTAFQRAKCAVFHDLWKKGYYMGGGLKFGGDFLVYRGGLATLLLCGIQSDSFASRSC